MKLTMVFGSIESMRVDEAPSCAQCRSVPSDGSHSDTYVEPAREDGSFARFDALTYSSLYNSVDNVVQTRGSMRIVAEF